MISSISPAAARDPVLTPSVAIVRHYHFLLDEPPRVAVASFVWAHSLTNLIKGIRSLLDEPFAQCASHRFDVPPDLFSGSALRGCNVVEVPSFQHVQCECAALLGRKLPKFVQDHAALLVGRQLSPGLA